DVRGRDRAHLVGDAHLDAERQQHDVLAVDHARNVVGIADVADDHVEVLVARGDRLRITDECGDAVPESQGLFDEAYAGLPGRAEDRQPHDAFRNTSCTTVATVKTNSTVKTMPAMMKCCGLPRVKSRSRFARFCTPKAAATVLPAISQKVSGALASAASCLL